MLIRRLITLATTVAMGFGLVALPSISTTASAAPARVTSTRSGAGYLARQIDAGGGHIVSFGSPDITDTAYAVLGLHAAGVGAKQNARAVAFLKTQVAHLVGSDGKDDPAALGYVIMAAVASNQDPRHFGGRQPVNNLVARLLATERTTGADYGLFGTGDPTYDGSFRQGVALAALAAADVKPLKALFPALWLLRQQCGSGLWESYRTDVTVPCVAADPNTFAGPDTNSTSMAVQGLAAFHVYPNALRTALSLLHVQTADGGYPFLATTGQSSDPDSTALVIQALVALHVKPGTAVAALANFQLGCSDPVDTRGAYFFPGDRSPNAFATVQSAPAAALKPLPLEPSSLSAAVPVTSCPTTTTTPPRTP